MMFHHHRQDLHHHRDLVQIPGIATTIDVPNENLVVVVVVKATNAAAVAVVVVVVVDRRVDVVVVVVVVVVVGVFQGVDCWNDQRVFPPRAKKLTAIVWRHS